jgi:hypothetical protein
MCTWVLTFLAEILMVVGSGMYVKASPFFGSTHDDQLSSTRIILAELIQKTHSFLFVHCYEIDN